MAFPAFGLTPPSLATYGMSFAGYTFGPGTNLEIIKLEGVDLPTVRTGDAGRPRDQGMFIGLDVMAGREITVTAQLHNNLAGTTFQEALQELAQATVPGGSIETPLYLNLPGYGTLATLARVRKRNMPLDVTFSLGNLANVTLLFASSDPRWYAPTQQASVTPPSTVAGFKFPLKFALSFGGGTVSGSLQVTNTGDIETRPILIVEGPCVNPSITNDTAPGSPNLTFNLTMRAGDKLEIDTDMHTATFYSSGSTIGSSRLYTLAQGSKWYVLEPGTSTLQFLTGAPGEGQLSVQWASSYIV